MSIETQVIKDLITQSRLVLAEARQLSTQRENEIRTEIERKTGELTRLIQSHQNLEAEYARGQNDIQVAQEKHSRMTAIFEEVLRR